MPEMVRTRVKRHGPTPSAVMQADVVILTPPPSRPWASGISPAEWHDRITQVHNFLGITREDAALWLDRANGCPEAAATQWFRAKDPEVRPSVTIECKCCLTRAVLC